MRRARGGGGERRRQPWGEESAVVFFLFTRGEERGEVRSVIRTLVARTRAAGAPGGETVRVEAGGYESLDHVEAL